MAEPHRARPYELTRRGGGPLTYGDLFRHCRRERAGLRWEQDIGRAGRCTDDRIIWSGGHSRSSHEGLQGLSMSE